MIDIINTNRALVEPFSDAVDEALLQYSQTEMNNGEAMEHLQNQEMQSIFETFDQSTQNDITIDLSIPQPYSLSGDDEINANVQSLNVQPRQVFYFVYSWVKDTVKQKSSVKPKLVNLLSVNFKSASVSWWLT